MGMVLAATALKIRAVVSHGPGSVSALKMEDIDRPAPADDGVLVRVRASSANPVDLFTITPVAHMQRGLNGAVVGTDFAGTVEAVGKNVTRFEPGDDVFGGARGAFAEYLAISEQGALVRKPAGVPFDQAGAVTVAGSTALQALRDHGRVQAGQRVLINGASGGVGTFAVQIARSFGAEVTAVCSTRNVELVRSIGAQRVIDYTTEDFTLGGERYDLMLDVAGNRSWSECLRVLEAGPLTSGLGQPASSTGRAVDGGRSAISSRCGWVRCVAAGAW